MRCPTCDMEITSAQAMGVRCVHCYNIRHGNRVPVEAPIKKAPAPAPKPIAPRMSVASPPVVASPVAPDPIIEDAGPKTITDLKVMLKSELMILATDLELDSEGTKDDLVYRIAEELGIE